MFGTDILFHFNRRILLETRQNFGTVYVFELFKVFSNEVQVIGVEEFKKSPKKFFINLAKHAKLKKRFPQNPRKKKQINLFETGTSNCFWCDFSSLWHQLDLCTLKAIYLLVAVVFAGQHLKRRLDDTTPQSKDKMEGRFFLNVLKTNNIIFAFFQRKKFT